MVGTSAPSFGNSVSTFPSITGCRASFARFGGSIFEHASSTGAKKVPDAIVVPFSASTKHASFPEASADAIRSFFFAGKTDDATGSGLGTGAGGGGAFTAQAT